MDEYDLIRRKHLVDGMSQRAISEELGYARNTVAKAIAHPIPPGYRLSEPRPKPALAPLTSAPFQPLAHQLLARRFHHPRTNHKAPLAILDIIRDRQPRPHINDQSIQRIQSLRAPRGSAAASTTTLQITQQADPARLFENPMTSGAQPFAAASPGYNARAASQMCSLTRAVSNT